MHPPPWHPPIELSAAELGIVSCIRRAKLFIFLRQIRHRLFDEQFQRELAKIYTDSPKGHPPVPPALDSSPLWGAGKVEDTYNLLGHALRKALGVIACQQGRELAVVAKEAGAQILIGSSLKAALDVELHIDRAYLSAKLVRQRQEI